MIYLGALILVIFACLFIVKPFLSDMKKMTIRVIQIVEILWIGLIILVFFELQGMASTTELVITSVVMLIPVIIINTPAVKRYLKEWQKRRGCKKEYKKITKYLNEVCGMLGETSLRQLNERLKMECPTEYLEKEQVQELISEYLNESSNLLISRLKEHLHKKFQSEPIMDTYEMYRYNRDYFQITHENTKDCFFMALELLVRDGVAKKLASNNAKPSVIIAPEDKAILKTIPFSLYKSMTKSAEENLESIEISLDNL